MVIYNTMQFRAPPEEIEVKRRGEKTRLSLEDLRRKIDLEEYQHLLLWVFQASEQLQLDANTKYIARGYFELSLPLCQDIQIQRYLQLMLVCFGLAIRLNEPPSVAAALTPQFLFATAGIPFHTCQHISLEITALAAVGMMATPTTPLDYLPYLAERFPWFPEAQRALPHLIELALTLPAMCQFSSEEVFFGSLLAVGDSKQLEVSASQRTVLERMTNCWGEARIASQLILQLYNDTLDDIPPP